LPLENMLATILWHKRNSLCNATVYTEIWCYSFIEKRWGWNSLRDWEEINLLKWIR